MKTPIKQLEEWIAENMLASSRLKSKIQELKKEEKHFITELINDYHLNGETPNEYLKDKL